MSRKKKVAVADDYEAFVATKLVKLLPTGLKDVPHLHPTLFPFQKDIVSWALRRGRAAIFASTGLGKSRQQIEWARCVAEHTGGKVLVLAPLAVASQTVSEAAKIDVRAVHAREPSDIGDHRIVVTNYERIHKFNAGDFVGVVCDESSILKHESSKTFGVMTELFKHHAFRLCATATPAPNDYTELGTHAEFLGICTRQEMLAEYFVHDGGSTQDWRLKGHARGPFWRWVASWACLVRKPSDLGYSDEAYELPTLSVAAHTIEADHTQAHAAGLLFATQAATLSERRAAKRGSIDARVEACVAAINAEPNEQWVVWCNLNDEQDALEKALKGQAVSIRGATDPEEKVALHDKWISGQARVMISKSSIFGFGLNWQHCARMAFVGVDDSWESYYQSVRRCWRFGQRREVEVLIFASSLEGAVIANLERKEADALRMGEELSNETRDVVREQIFGQARSTLAYTRPKITIPKWLKTEGAA